MSGIIRPEILGLTPYKPGKPPEELERELGLHGSIKLASNENCLGPSPLALEVAGAAVAAAHIYPDGDHHELKARIAELTGFGPERIVVGCGTTEIIQLLAYATLGPGRRAVHADQTFIMYKLATLAAGGEPVAVALDGSERHDLSAMAETARQGRTHLVFLANPSNPTGTYLGAAALAAFIDRLPPEVLAVVDEAYCEYETASDYPDALEHARQGRRVMVLRTFSKVYGLAGMRVGYAIGPADVVDALNRIRSPFNVTSLGLAMARAALDDTAHVKRSRAHNLEQMAWLERQFARLALAYTPSVGNFVLVEFGRPGGEVYDALLRQGVIARPMGVYGFPTRLRISVGTAAENERLVAALERLPGR